MFHLKPLNTEPHRHAGRVATWALGLAAATVGATALVLGLVWFAAKPRPGEWQHAFKLGPVSVKLSVPVLIRWATHPLARPLMHGQSFSGQSGRWQVQAPPEQTHWTLRCAPCRLHIAALGPQAITLEQAELVAQPAGAHTWRGVLKLGEAAAGDDEDDSAGHGARADATLMQPQVVWQAKLQADGLHWQASMAPTPIAAVVRLFAQQVPEAKVAQIEGTLAWQANASLGAQGWRDVSVKPQITGLSVSGLGTESLQNAAPPASCKRRASDPDESVQGWLPKAVIAAEDQRFYEHAGYDLNEWTQSLAQNQRRQAQPNPAHARGASTITQQLAKVVFVGDERSATRKLREWLYAVEMERTLGKARILQLYLSLVPWGDDVCGAQAAARRHLGKSVNTLKPHEAAWLASLLNRPDAKLAQWRHSGRIDRSRTEQVIQVMRPLSRAARDAHAARLDDWSPASTPGPSDGARPYQSEPLNTPSL